MKHRIAIFASGGGSNAEAIMNYFQNHSTISVALIVSNKFEAFIHERAAKHKIPSYTHTAKGIENGEIEAVLKAHEINFVVLAGYLKKISSSLVNNYPNRIVNIHPALLPKYGGKGMYGMNVHKAVVANGERESGITIHYVNENYDEGNIIEQHSCAISPDMTVENVQQAVLKLEHTFFAPCIERIINK